MLVIPWVSKGEDELLGIYNKPEAVLKVQLYVWTDSKIWQLHKCRSLLCSFLKFLVSLHFPFSGLTQLSTRVREVSGARDAGREQLWVRKVCGFYFAPAECSNGIAKTEARRPEPERSRCQSTNPFHGSLQRGEEKGRV